MLGLSGVTASRAEAAPGPTYLVTGGFEEGEVQGTLGSCSPAGADFECTTLRAAVEANNATATGGGRIIFGGTGVGAVTEGTQIDLTKGQLSITKDLDIEGFWGSDGEGYMPRLTLAAREGSRAIFVAKGANVRLWGLIIAATASSDPYIPTNSGGINNRGTLTMEDCAITGGRAVVEGANSGGNIRNWGTLTIDNCSLSDGAADFGGGIYNETGADLTLRDARVSDNNAKLGAGIYNVGDLNVTDSAIDSNSATDFGGGIYQYMESDTGDGGSISILRSSIRSNNSGAGGGIYSENAAPDKAVLISESYFGNNQALTGGGIYAYSGDLTVQNSTIASNSADSSGDAFYVYSGAVVSDFNTIAFNSSPTSHGGVYFDDGSAEFRATLIVGNEGESGLQCGGEFDIGSKGFNVTTDNSCGLNDATDVSAADASVVFKTSYAEDNGGPTSTIALNDGTTTPLSARGLSENPAIDLIPTDSCTFAADQRGVLRPQGAKCDVGAFEYEQADSRDGGGNGGATDGGGSSSPTTSRLAGGDRYGTAAAISQELFPNSGAQVVYVATGGEFPDALTGAAAAHAAGGPLLLVTASTIPQATATELARLKPGRIVVLGGEGAVSTGVFLQLQAYASNVTRIGGGDRYETAILLAHEFTTTGGTVLLASGATFADAVSAGSLYSSSSGPMLLVKPGGGLTQAVKDELKRLKPARVILIGGTSAISSEAEADLNSLGLQVIRLAGADRYGTSAAVADWVRTNAGYSGLTIAVSGRDFPDGLTAGVLAGARSAPLILSDGNCWTVAAAEVLKRLAPTSLKLIGGSYLLPASIADLQACN